MGFILTASPIQYENMNVYLLGFQLNLPIVLKVKVKENTQNSLGYNKLNV